MPSYIWHHPFGKDYAPVVAGQEDSRKGCFEHPCGTIEFLLPLGDGWGGSGTPQSGRHYDDESTKEYSPIRLGR
jgi:hypothetical protein